MEFQYQAWSADGKREVTLTGPLSPDAIIDEFLPEPTPDGCDDRASGELFGKYAEVRDPMGEIWKFA